MQGTRNIKAGLSWHGVIIIVWLTLVKVKAHLETTSRLLPKMNHPKDLGAPEVAAFLSHLAEELTVSAATQYQALKQSED
jgi:hypothetical protein